MTKKLLICLSVLLSVFFLFGCVADNELRPAFNENEIWVCEEPYAYFSYDSESDSFLGKLNFNDFQYDFFEYENTGHYMAFFKPEAIIDNVIYPEGNTLLSGSVEYFEGYFVLTVKKDPEDLFNGELPVMEFVRYSLEEFEEKFGSDKLQLETK